MADTDTRNVTICHSQQGADVHAVFLQQKIIHSQITKRTEITSRDDDGINRLKWKIIQEMEKSKQLGEDLFLIVKVRNNEVQEMKNTITSLVTKVIQHEEEYKSLSVFWT